MYAEILRDKDISNIITKCIKSKMLCDVIEVTNLTVSRHKEIEARACVVCGTENGRFKQNIIAIFQDFQCIIAFLGFNLYRKPYAEMMVDIIRERGSRFNLSSVDYKHDYNKFIKSELKSKSKQYRHDLDEVKQEYEQNIIK